MTGTIPSIVFDMDNNCKSVDVGLEIKKRIIPVERL
jgi:hypothetical protein